MKATDIVGLEEGKDNENILEEEKRDDEDIVEEEENNDEKRVDKKKRKNDEGTIELVKKGRKMTKT
jgi:hypothetical protein